MLYQYITVNTVSFQGFFARDLLYVLYQTQQKNQCMHRKCSFLFQNVDNGLKFEYMVLTAVTTMKTSLILMQLIIGF